MSSLPRMTPATRLVLAELLNGGGAKYGLGICKATGLASGTVQVILRRFEDDHGWLVSVYEEIDPKQVERPRRRYYRLTPDGARRALEALARPPSRPRRRSIT